MNPNFAPKSSKKSGPVDKFIHQIVPSLLALLLLLSIILQYTSVPTSISYVLIAFAYVAVVSYFVLYHQRIVANKRFSLLFLSLVLVISLRLLTDPSTGNIARLIVLLTFTTANIFLIPLVIPLDSFLDVLSKICLVLVILGLFPYLGLPVSFAYIDLSLWGADIYWYQSLQPITSIFPNPNQFGGLLLVGCIAVAHEYIERPSIASAIMFLTISGGLAMTNYRTGWAILGILIVSYVSYVHFGAQSFRLVVLGSLLGISTALLMIFDFLPGPNAVSEMTLNGRQSRWIANVQALVDRPLVGYGFSGVSEFEGLASNPHNSYLRMFAAFGLIGGTLYLLFVVGTAISGTLRASSTTDVTIAILLIASCILQIFNQLTIIGISLRSTLLAIAIGYYIVHVDPSPGDGI